MLVQKHQLDNSESKMSELDAALNTLEQNQTYNNNALDQALAELDGLLGEEGIDSKVAVTVDITNELDDLLQSVEQARIQPCVPYLSTLDLLEFNDDMSWEEYQYYVEKYALRNAVDLDADPFKTLMSPMQRIELEKRIEEEFTIKNAQCDKYDYLIAGTCGVIGGLIDVFFVGMPGEGKLTNIADNSVNLAVEKFAGACGWEGAREGSDPTKSAISFLERNYKINYDQATTFGCNGTDGAVNNLSPKNHHLKSLGHSPDLIGLFSLF